MRLKQEYSRQNNSRKYLSESVCSLRQNYFFGFTLYTGCFRRKSKYFRRW